MSDLIAKFRKRKDHAMNLTTGRAHATAGNKDTRSLRVRLVQPAPQPPATLIERTVVSTLKREAEMAFGPLVERVAAELYSAELRGGAWMVDLGLFGRSLFVPDVVRELEAGNEILWEIMTSCGETDGVLSDLS